MIQLVNPLTFEEYLEQYSDDGGIYELINGEMSPTAVLKKALPLR
jgi:hypothetical protein